MNKPNLLSAVVGLVVSVGVIYAYAYVAGKGWKASQK